MATGTNFGELAATWPDSARAAAAAEAQVAASPVNAARELRVFVERLVRGLYRRWGLIAPGPAPNLYELLSSPLFTRRLPQPVVAKLHGIRRLGNAAAHGDDVDAASVERALHDAHDVGRLLLVLLDGRDAATLPAYNPALRGGLPPDLGAAQTDPRSARGSTRRVRQGLQPGDTIGELPPAEPGRRATLPTPDRRVGRVRRPLAGGLLRRADGRALLMFRVFAVDPSTVARDWGTFRATAGRFDMGLGRMIADFPDRQGGTDWAREVLDRARKTFASDNDLKRLEIELRRLKSAITPVPQRYNRGRTWLANAVEAHARSAWQAVLSDDPGCTLDVVVRPDEISDTEGLFCIPHDGEVEREAAAIAALLAPLLHTSNRLVLVDPHFMDKGPLRWSPITAALVREARRGAVNLTETIIHAGVSRDGEGDVRYDNDRWRAHLQAQLAPRLPRGTSATVLRWDRPEEFHARYVLTNKGGVAIDWGLDERPGGRTDIHRLTYATWQSRLDRFEPAKTTDRPFDRVDLSGIAQ